MSQKYVSCFLQAPDQPSDEASKLPDTEGDRNINEWESKSTTTQVISYLNT